MYIDNMYVCSYAIIIRSQTTIKVLAMYVAFEALKRLINRFKY